MTLGIFPVQPKPLVYRKGVRQPGPLAPSPAKALGLGVSCCPRGLQCLAINALSTHRWGWRLRSEGCHLK